MKTTNGSLWLLAALVLTAPGCIIVGGSACPAGTVRCGSVCVNTASNSLNCGACGRACAASESCAGGLCYSTSCGGGLTACGAQCVDTTTDPAHCGGCSLVCPTGSTCNASSCVCTTGLTACGASCVNTMTDSGHCGGCSLACPAGSSCTSGVCVCAPGLTACGTSCVDIATNQNNCGGCGTACPLDTYCAGGLCYENNVVEATACTPETTVDWCDVDGDFITYCAAGLGYGAFCSTCCTNGSCSPTGYPCVSGYCESRTPGDDVCVCVTC